MCDDAFQEWEAAVACKSVQLEQGTWVSGFGTSSAPIWLEDLMCRGDELDLRECGRLTAAAVGDTNCGHDEDVGLCCVNASDVTSVKVGSLAAFSYVGTGEYLGDLIVTKSGAFSLWVSMNGLIVDGMPRDLSVTTLPTPSP